MDRATRNGGASCMMIEKAKARPGDHPGGLSDIFPGQGKGSTLAPECSATARPSQLVEGR